MNHDGPVGEFGLIRRIRRRVLIGSSTSIAIGDDCAALKLTPGRDVLITTDMLMDGRHFVLAEAGAKAVGRKAIGVNLSDIAAMAGEPVAAVIALALPRHDGQAIADELLDGMLPIAESFGLSLVGGDTNAWEGPLVITVTILGQTTARGPVRRSGAKPGDVVLVTGPLGGSLLGRHLDPAPRIRESLALAEAETIHAMIDISDGLAADLGHILEESGDLGAILDAASIPISPDALTLSGQDGRSPIDHALHDGEDFELCLTVAPETAARLLANPPCPLHAVGRITAEPGLRLANHGHVEAIVMRGFDHLLD
jgi:thiamine-monophosphate kinase